MIQSLVPMLASSAVALILASCFSSDVPAVDGLSSMTSTPKVPGEPSEHDSAALEAFNAQRDALKNAQLLREKIARELEAIRAELAASDATIEQKRQAVEDLQSLTQHAMQH